MQSSCLFLFHFIRRILIDTGDLDVPEYINHLDKVLKEEQATIGTVILTHWHHDHVGGVRDVLKTCAAKGKKVNLLVQGNPLSVLLQPNQLLKHTPLKFLFPLMADIIYTSCICDLNFSQENFIFIGINESMSCPSVVRWHGNLIV